MNADSQPHNDQNKPRQRLHSISRSSVSRNHRAWRMHGGRPHTPIIRRVRTPTSYLSSVLSPRRPLSPSRTVQPCQAHLTIPHFSHTIIRAFILTGGLRAPLPPPVVKRPSSCFLQLAQPYDRWMRATTERRRCLSRKPCARLAKTTRRKLVNFFIRYGESIFASSIYSEIVGKAVGEMVGW